MERRAEVPWKDWTEWALVRYGLCVKTWSQNVDLANCAIELVKLWQWRNGSVPLIIESTAQIVRILLEEKPAETENETEEHAETEPTHKQCNDSVSISGPKNDSNRLALALVLIRLVNGLTEIHQRGKYLKSVAILAKQMKLPPLLVDLRHDATHKHMPSMQALVYCAEECLEWMEEYYWAPQERQVHVYETLRPKYSHLLTKVFRNMLSIKSNNRVHELVNSMMSECSEYAARHAMIPVVVAEHLVICTSVNGNSLSQQKLAHLHKNREKSANEPGQIDQDAWTLFESSFRSWQPILSKLVSWRRMFAPTLFLYTSRFLQFCAQEEHDRMGSSVCFYWLLNFLSDEDSCFKSSGNQEWKQALDIDYLLRLCFDLVYLADSVINPSLLLTLVEKCLIVLQVSPALKETALQLVQLGMAAKAQRRLGSSPAAPTNNDQDLDPKEQSGPQSSIEFCSRVNMLLASQTDAGHCVRGKRMFRGFQLVPQETKRRKFRSNHPGSIHTWSPLWTLDDFRQLVHSQYPYLLQFSNAKPANVDDTRRVSNGRDPRELLLQHENQLILGQQQDLNTEPNLDAGSFVQDELSLLAGSENSVPSTSLFVPSINFELTKEYFNHIRSNQIK